MELVVPKLAKVVVLATPLVNDMEIVKEYVLVDQHMIDRVSLSI